MSLGEHFREFRRRALIAALAILIAGIWGWIIYEHTIIPWLEHPLNVVHKHNPKAGLLNFSANGVTEAFGIKLKLSIWFGILVSSPVWLWQIWGFLAPGLTKKEKRVSRGFICTAVPLFALGCWVATLALPNAISFLIGSTPNTSLSANFTDANKYVSFVTKFILAFGLAFLLPVFLTGLNMLRILPARLMIRGWRVAVMLVAVFSAVMSPSPDAWSMLALMVPMIVLYFAAVLVALILDKRRAKAQGDARAEWLDLPDDQRSTL